MSDWWTAYVNVNQINRGIYEHRAVIHDRIFVRPDDFEIHR